MVLTHCRSGFAVGHSAGILSPVAPFFSVREGTKGSTVIVLYIVFKHEMVILVSRFRVLNRHLSNLKQL